MSTRLSTASNAKPNDAITSTAKRIQMVREQEKLIAKEVAKRKRDEILTTNSKKQKQQQMNELKELQEEIVKTKQQIILVQINEAKAQKDATNATMLQQQTDAMKIELEKQNQIKAKLREAKAIQVLKQTKKETEEYIESMHQINKKKLVVENLNKIEREKAQQYRATEEKKPVEIELQENSNPNDKKSNVQAYVNTYYHNTIIMKHAEPEKTALEKANDETQKKEKTKIETMKKDNDQYLVSKKRGNSALQQLIDNKEKDSILEELERLDKADRKMHSEVSISNTHMKHNTIEIDEKRKQEVMEKVFEEEVGISTVLPPNIEIEPPQAEEPMPESMYPKASILCKIDDGKSPYSQPSTENKDNAYASNGIPTEEKQKSSEILSPLTNEALKSSKSSNKNSDVNNGQAVDTKNKLNGDMSESSSLLTSQGKTLSASVNQLRNTMSDMHSPCESDLSHSQQNLQKVLPSVPTEEKKDAPLTSNDIESNNVPLHNMSFSPANNQAPQLQPIKEEDVSIDSSAVKTGKKNESEAVSSLTSTMKRIGQPQNALPQANKNFKVVGSPQSNQSESAKKSPIDSANKLNVGTDDIDAFIKESKEFLKRRLEQQQSPDSEKSQSPTKKISNDGKSLLSQFLEYSEEKKKSPVPVEHEEKKVENSPKFNENRNDNPLLAQNATNESAKHLRTESHTSNRVTDYNYSPSSEDKKSPALNEYLTENEEKPAIMTFNMCEKVEVKNPIPNKTEPIKKEKKEKKEKTKEELAEIRKQMMKRKKVVTAVSQSEEVKEENKQDLAKTELMRRLAMGEKAKVGKEDMKKLTEKNYERLPEIQKKMANQKKKEEIKERIKTVKEMEKKRRQEILSKKTMP